MQNEELIKSNMKKKLLTLAFAFIVFSLPLWPIVNGRPLTNMLKDLYDELQTAYEQREETQQRFNDDYERQHQQLIDVITQSNELSILLYTQEQYMTFNLAYALKKVTADYKDFSNDRRPYDRIVNSLTVEIDRYARLIEALRRLPPMMKEIEVDIVPDSLLYHNDSLDQHISSTASSLESEVIRIAAKAANGLGLRDSCLVDSCIVDSSISHGAHTSLHSDDLISEILQTQILDSISSPFILDEAGRTFRDSCIFYASELLKMHADNREIVIGDSAHYQEAYWRMKETYDYAEARYRALEHYVFYEGQTPFMEILAHPGEYWEKVKADLDVQYDFFIVEDGKNKSDSTSIQTTGVQADDSKTVKSSDDNKASFLDGYTSKSVNYILVLFCIVQLVFLVVTWALTYLILRLILRYAKPKHFVTKKKLPLFAILVGTIIYFALFGYFWHGGEYIQLGARNINTFLWLLIAISGSVLLRVNPEQIWHGIQLYTPTILIAVMIIFCRISFLPDRLMIFLFPPILFLIVLRQLFFCIRKSGKATPIDSTLGWVSLVIYLIAFTFAFLGYTFVALLILVWWYFQLAVLLTVVCVSDLLKRYRERWLDKRVASMRRRITYVTGADREELLFGATWFYDLIKDVVIPVLLLLSLPACIRLSLNIFDFTDLYEEAYCNPFVQFIDKDGTATLTISAQSIVYLLILFVVLRYFNRAIHILWRYARYTIFMQKHKRTTIRPNEINLSLANSIITVIVWMAFALVVVFVWQVPTGSLGLVAGGLSAGIGLALKDIINNFIYGIQIMGGRLRVGDWIECDGVRGKVTSVNYQCVQVETTEGTEMSFLNASLFGKNFNNLTRNNAYELTKIVVSVAYGTDIPRVREVLVKAMQKMRTKDQYGRAIVDPKYGITVVVSNMSDSAVDIAVKQYVLVAERISYVDRSKEVIYEALNDAGITIPFPQCDVHLIQEM